MPRNSTLIDSEGPKPHTRLLDDVRPETLGNQKSEGPGPHLTPLASLGLVLGPQVSAGGPHHED